MKMKFVIVGVCVLLCGCSSESSSPTTVGVDRDNTAVNERDAGEASITPMDQSNAPEDIDQVATIRSEVLEIDGLSINGRNVKIITDRGKVVLRGPVASETERDSIAEIAKRIAGEGNVNNLLEVEKE